MTHCYTIKKCFFVVILQNEDELYFWIIIKFLNEIKKKKNYFCYAAVGFKVDPNHMSKINPLSHCIMTAPSFPSVSLAVYIAVDNSSWCNVFCSGGGCLAE